MHGWGSDFMIAIVLIHMVQVFLFGAYKFPRELTWIVGVLLLLLTLGMAFTGQVMRFDQDAYWGLGIGASIVSRVPLIGAPLVHLMLGGPIIGGSNFVPLLYAACLCHSWHSAGQRGCACLDGAAAWSQRLADARSPRIQSHIRARISRVDGKDRHPLCAGCGLEGCGLRRRHPVFRHGGRFFFGPFGPSGQPDPTIIQTAPKPDFAFLWIYAVLAFLPPSIETPVMLVVPVLAIAGMLLLPLFAAEGERIGRAVRSQC